MNKVSGHHESVNNEEIRAHQRAFLEKVKAATEPKNYNIEGVEIKVNPGVFPPATDTKILAAHIKTHSGERVLDLTTGAGTFSVIAGLQGASGIAVDINPKAIENAKENFSTYKVGFDAIESDLFENIPLEQFDQAYANGPFFEGEITEPLDNAAYGYKKFIKDILSGIRSRLKTGGKLLIVIHASADLEYFEETAHSNNLSVHLIESRKSNDGQRTYNLYEVRASS